MDRLVRQHLEAYAVLPHLYLPSLQKAATEDTFQTQRLLCVNDKGFRRGVFH